MGRFRRDQELEGELGLGRGKKTEKPKRWRVLLHNDDYTTQEFVVDVLTRHFHKNPAEATQIMWQVHLRGVGVAGIFPKDIAETKVAEVTAEARERGMPLLLTLEED